MGNLTNLTYLMLGGNQLPVELEAVASRQGASGVVAWLAARAEKSVRLSEAKVLVVGEGAVGKTSLVERLCGGEFVTRPRTHGIELRTTEVDRDPDPLSLRFWDFGGQDVYRVTHQFFFTPDTVYLVVWHAREGTDRGDVEGWLERIRLRVGSGARVILVATHSDRHRADVDVEYFRGVSDGAVVDFVAVDSSTGEGIDRLCALIAEQAEALPHVGSSWPASYQRFAEAVAARSEPQMSWQDYVGLAGGHGLDAQQAESVAIRLSVMGRMTYFADQVSLKGRVVLKPDWLTAAISYALNDKQIKDADGVASHERLLELWTNPPSDPDFDDEPVRFDREDFPYLLQLMEHHAVSFQLPDRPASLIGQLVSNSQPPDLGLPDRVKAWPVKRLVCEMGNRGELPGLIPWLTVRNHPYLTVHRWRRGALLHREDDDAWALFELRRQDTLRLTVWAEHPDSFFHAQRSSLENVLAEWPALDAEFSVGCPTEDLDSRDGFCGSSSSCVG